MKNGVMDVTGIILRVSQIGERDRRVTVLTSEHGKLSFFARGAARPGSPFMGVTRPFLYGAFSLFQGRDSYTLEAAQIKNYFEELGRDVETTCYAGYFLELSDYYNRELAPASRSLELLYRSFLALLKPSIPKRLTRRIFELRSMVIDGAYDPEPPRRDASCCRYTWHYICTAPMEKLYTFSVSHEILTELEQNLNESLRRYVDRELHSLEILRMMTESEEHISG